MSAASPDAARVASWDGRYGATDGYVFGTEPNDFLREHAGALPPAGRVLCIGDGEGRNGTYLATLGHVVTSVDLSSVGLAKAEALAAERGVTIRTVVADLRAFVATDDGRGPWDAVVSIFCHLPTAVRADVYPALVASLRPGGVLLLESYTPAQIGRGTGGPPEPDPTLTAEQIRSEFAGLTFTHLVELERDVVEGPGHTGAASVVQAIGAALPR